MSECAGCGRVEGCCLCELLGYFPSVSALHTKHSNTVSGRNLWDLHQPELSQTVVWLWPGCWHSGDITHRKKFFLSWKPIDWALAESSFITAWSGDSADNESRWHQPPGPTACVQCPGLCYSLLSCERTTSMVLHHPGCVLTALFQIFGFDHKLEQQFSQTPNFVGGKLWRHLTIRMRSNFNL